MPARGAPGTHLPKHWWRETSHISRGLDWLNCQGGGGSAGHPQAAAWVPHPHTGLLPGQGKTDIFLPLLGHPLFGGGPRGTLKPW